MYTHTIHAIRAINHWNLYLEGAGDINLSNFTYYLRNACNEQMES